MLRKLTLSPVLFAVVSSAGAVAQSSPAPERAVQTLHSTAKLVVVDVVVTDRQHHPIHGLKQADFTLLENKTPQTIKSFEEHASTPDAVKMEPFPTLPPSIFTNYTPAPVNGPVNILLLDTLNTPMQDQAYVRNQMLDYLKHIKPGISMAVFGLNTKLVMLQSFTSDPEVLKRAISEKRPGASPLLDDAVSGVSTTDALSDMVAATGNATAETIANLATFEASQQSFQLMLRAQYTLDGLNNLARYLIGIPGRKNLIWFSGSFPIDILPDADLAAMGGDPFAAVASSEEEYRETTNLLARSQVAVYPIDARGLFVNPSMSAANSGAKFARNPTAFAKDQTAFFNKTASEHDTMQRMAQDTGGEAFVNTNGLSQAVAKAIDFGSNYYTLTYTPTNTEWKGEYRKIQVRLQEQGYELSFRRGYYADDPDAPPKKGQKETAATAAPAASTMQKAMTRGAPQATQIVFKAQVTPASNQDEPAVAPGNRSDPNPKVFHGPFRRYGVDFAADPRMVQIDLTPDHFYQAGLEFVVFLYDPNGQPLNISEKNVTARMTSMQYESVLHRGIPFHLDISVPVKGEYFLRIAVHDTVTDRVGSIEIPVSSVKNLPPVASSAPPSPPRPAAR